MPPQTVQPLRIQKGGLSPSPSKMNNTSPHRPLAELGLMERRRNSPSVNHAAMKDFLNGDSSPFDPSPYNAATEAASARLFWQTRDLPSPTRKSQLPTAEKPKPNLPYNDSPMSLPEFASLLGDDELEFAVQSPMSPSPEPVQEGHSEQYERSAITEDLSLQRPMTPDEQLLPPVLPTYDYNYEEDIGTPESVIRHYVENESSPADSPVVPEPVATIKAPGGRLKTRPSATPADLAAMAATRRQVSGGGPGDAVVPPIPERHRDRPSIVAESLNETSILTTADDEGDMDEGSAEPRPARAQSRRKTLIRLDVPMNALADDLRSGIDKEFDRVLETQKRGYLMRHNTNLVVASSNGDEVLPSIGGLAPTNSRGARSAGNSPRKPSHERPQSWSVEPWNGAVRRKSIRDPSSSPRKRPVGGPVPPLPGQESSVSHALTSVVEDGPAVDEPEAGVERGRLFVKVIGLKDLNLPLVKGQPSWFNLTLDNGIHCVQTTWLELGKNAPIGQEFELIVLDDLEFTLTLQTEPLQPPVQASIETPSRSVKTPKSSTFSRVFASPKKRKELEKKQKEEAQQAERQKQQDAQGKKAGVQSNTWDLLNSIVARDGTFARAYFSLKEHEDRAYGRPFLVETDCFNEWATEPATSSGSVKRKRGDMQRRPPYRIGKLELQLLFVPKPKGVPDTQMPKSLNACVRELREAEANASRRWEGHLSQQGGDCPFWRRRFFKLDGSKLTAYHETTRQPRATISLAKATKLIDDRSALLQKEVSKKGGRRKSAFAEEEEGYMFVEEGFRVRFANGEIIDFYADSAAEKEGWMKVLGETVGKETVGPKSWTELVLARERAAEAKERQAKPQPPQVTAASSSNDQTHSPPPSRKAPPPPVDKSPRHQQTVEPASPQMPRRTQPTPRSMLF